jgi:hypothetical protein
MQVLFQFLSRKGVIERLLDFTILSVVLFRAKPVFLSRSVEMILFVVGLILLALVLVCWFRVSPFFLAYVVFVFALSNVLSGAFLVIVSLVPVVYLGILVALVLQDRKRPPFQTLKFLKQYPFGSIIFDRVLLALLAPHKSVYGLSTVRWTESEVVVSFEESFWLRNPFQSVDVGDGVFFD